MTAITPEQAVQGDIFELIMKRDFDLAKEQSGKLIEDILFFFTEEVPTTQKDKCRLIDSLMTLVNIVSASAQ